jgi:hypothetical protein
MKSAAAKKTANNFWWLVDGFRNSLPIEPLIFLSCIFLSSQPAIRKENAGKENKNRKWVGYF